MSITAKVLCTVAKPNESIDLFNVVEKIEKAVNALVRQKARSLQGEAEHLMVTMRKQQLATAETTIKSPVGPCRSLYTYFSLGKDARRMLQIIINPADQSILPEQGTVLLSLGMGGEYREILAACGKALAGDDAFWYADDTRDGFLSGRDLQQLLLNEADEVA